MKKLLLISLTALSTTNVFASLSSPFPSSVEGLDIANVHVVAQSQSTTVLRGSAPLGKVQMLKDFGVTEVLIFKNETKNEVQQEVAELAEAGFSKRSVHRISFPWKDVQNFHETCVQALQGLEILKKAFQKNNGAIYFHCTVGEDRTGLLAGLFSQMVHGGRSLQVFQEELCAKGYEAGDQHKPMKVVQAVRDNLTPIFVFLSGQIENRNLSISDFDQLSCDGIEENLAVAEEFKCN